MSLRSSGNWITFLAQNETAFEIPTCSGQNPGRTIRTSLATFSKLRIAITRGMEININCSDLRYEMEEDPDNLLEIRRNIVRILDEEETRLGRLRPTARVHYPTSPSNV